MNVGRNTRKIFNGLFRAIVALEDIQKDLPDFDVSSLAKALTRADVERRKLHARLKEEGYINDTKK